MACYNQMHQILPTKQLALEPTFTPLLYYFFNIKTQDFKLQTNPSLIPIIRTKSFVPIP